MHKKKSILIVLGLCLSVILAYSDSPDEKNDLSWNQRAVYYNESAELSISLTGLTGNYSLQLWSDPPFGKPGIMKEQEITLSGEPVSTTILLSFDDTITQYVSQNDLENEISLLGIENEEEKQMVTRELFEEAYDLMKLRARLYDGDILIAQSPIIAVAVSFY